MPVVDASSEYPVVAERKVRGDQVFTIRAPQVILNIGLVAIGLTVVLSILTRSTTVSTEVPAWLVGAALVALAVGIPHGAVDHLTLQKSLPARQLAGLGLIYLVIAVAAAAAVIAAPGVAFLVVLAMTVWHFGTGDVEAMHELDGTPQESGITRIVHALAVGSAPVLLPLTSPASVSTLTAIEPRLAEFFTPGFIVGLRTVVLSLIVISLVILIHQKRTRATLELTALTVLGYVVSPLLAFAVYFGFWHALRHTARLTENTYTDITPRSLGRTFIQGIPALIGFIVAVAILAAFASSINVSNSWLWFGLAIVWGLTVPHMILVSQFDRRKRKVEPAKNPELFEL